MFSKGRLVLAVAVLAGSASLALAQSAPHDYQDDKPLSYGPQSPGRAASTANPAQAPIGRDVVNPHDTSDDKTNSYGVRN